MAVVATRSGWLPRDAAKCDLSDAAKPLHSPRICPEAPASGASSCVVVSVQPNTISSIVITGPHYIAQLDGQGQLFFNRSLRLIRLTTKQSRDPRQRLRFIHQTVHRGRTASKGQKPFARAGLAGQIRDEGESTHKRMPEKQAKRGLWRWWQRRNKLVGRLFCRFRVSARQRTGRRGLDGPVLEPRIT